MLGAGMDSRPWRMKLPAGAGAWRGCPAVGGWAGGGPDGCLGCTPEGQAEVLARPAKLCEAASFAFMKFGAVNSHILKAWYCCGTACRPALV